MLTSRSLERAKSGQGSASPTVKNTGGKPGRPSSRERIVAAAIDVVMESGAAHLSLEAVAERAGVSKGGLLYNFPNKVALLKALVAEHIIESDIRRMEAEAELGPCRNRTARGFVAAAATEAACGGKPPSGFLAAIAENPDLVAPVRARNAALTARFRDSDDPILSLIAFLAVEGLDTLDLLEANPLNADDRAAVYERLEAMLAAKTE
nr:TetR family transcriptional regulator [Chthonobacter albigriseus]